ncbi:thioredoxin [Flavobacterium suaedae]|uniref:Thioredoxin n=1 Tax=Flavobacterium suaedae TaxID=1767027 RepID=A0ABQ1JDA6_9FLAO|nr:TlpA disulfide reductase family protein [Flavobacterium suaedae]GGB65669.1 thioredoxin [Flavobacterium suaedae]
MKNSYTIIVFCFLIVIFSLNSSNAQTNEKEISLPDLELKLHNDEVLNLSELKGKVVLLDFWYRGCAPCLEAMPELIKLQKEFKDDLVIIGINKFDFKEDIVAYFEYKKTNYPSTYKVQKDIDKYLNITVEGYPTVVLYDKEGNMIKKDFGYSKGRMRSLYKAIKRAVKR